MNWDGISAIAELSFKGYLTWYNGLLNTPGGAAFWEEVSIGHAPDLVEALEVLKNDTENPYRYTSAFDMMPFLREESSAQKHLIRRIGGYRANSLATCCVTTLMR